MDSMKLDWCTVRLCIFNGMFFLLLPLIILCKKKQNNLCIHQSHMTLVADLCLISLYILRGFSGESNQSIVRGSPPLGGPRGGVGSCITKESPCHLIKLLVFCFFSTKIFGVVYLFTTFLANF